MGFEAKSTTGSTKEIAFGIDKSNGMSPSFHIKNIIFKFVLKGGSLNHIYNIKNPKGIPKCSITFITLIKSCNPQEVGSEIATT
ncbi:MAG: hypothetical protein ACFFB9_17715 [Promethearchaeota archaeon]